MSWSRLMMFLGIVLFLGCGMMDSPKDETLKEITLPQKSTLSIPEVLRTPSLQQRYIYDKNLNWINKYVIYIDDIIQEQKLFILFANEIMPQLNQLCSNKSLCNISSNQLQLHITTQLVDKIHCISSDIDINQTDFYIDFGEIYLKNENSNYKLSMDISNIVSKLCDINITKQIDSIEWSSDSKKVITDSYYIDDEIISSFKIRYLEQLNGEENMDISEYFRDKNSGEDYRFTFKLSDINDINQTQKIYSNLISYELNSSDIIEEVDYISNGEININGGYLYSSVNWSDLSYIEKAMFNNQGELQELISCYSDENDCEMDDERTWIEEDIY